MKALLIPIALLFASASIAQQSTVDQVLQQVLVNNKRVSAHAAEVEALRLQERTGLSLPDPSVDFDYMNGSPATAGQQTDLTVTQPFDFPTAYGARRQVAELRTTQHEQEAIAARREVLLDAQRTCVALVHANKRALLLAERHAAAVRYRDGMRQRFAREAATILDRNKAELLEAGIAADVQAAEMERLALLQHLAELNGGNTIAFADTVYPTSPEMPAFETYQAAMEAADPTLRVLETEVQVSEQRTRAFKATGLPGFEIGYRYQGILGADYQGVHAGMSIPLWSNRHQVKQQQQWTEAHTLRTAEHKVEHFYEARHLYDRTVALRATANDYQQRLAGASSVALLEKAFHAGQLTSLEYQMELMLLQESTDRWLALELHYQDALAELFKYRL
ncbi:MAG: TolC family protein [Flavobacteriales bacterium]|nr:TolC family protein [Flavobacteriales bacterium]